MTIAALAVEWHQVSRDFDTGCKLKKSDEQMFDRLVAVEAAINEASIRTPEDMLAAAIILLSPGDPPDFADSFRQALYEQLLRSEVYAKLYPEWAAEREAA